MGGRDEVAGTVRPVRSVGHDVAHESHWVGEALLRPGVLAFAGAAGPTEAHAHHAVQVMIADTPLHVTDATGWTVRGTRLIVPADVTHRIDVGSARATFVYLDPDTPAGRRAGALGAVTWAQPSLLVRIVDAPLADVLSTIVDEFGRHVSSAPHGHPVVHAAVKYLADRVAAGPVGTAEVAAVIGLSTSRLTHLFTAEIGLPLRRYVLWLRLMIAFRAVADGADLTSAAHGAGFTDSAHLTRTCKAMFGLAPSVMRSGIDVIVDAS